MELKLMVMTDTTQPTLSKATKCIFGDAASSSSSTTAASQGADRSSSMTTGISTAHCISKRIFWGPDFQFYFLRTPKKNFRIAYFGLFFLELKKMDSQNFELKFKIEVHFWRLNCTGSYSEKHHDFFAWKKAAKLKTNIGTVTSWQWTQQTSWSFIL